jgi:hypothetical protein
MFGFADDTAIIFENKDQLETNTSLPVQIFERLGLGVHTKSRSNPQSKTKAMFTPADTTLLSDRLPPDLALLDADRTMPFTEQHVYLGYLLHHSLCDDHAIEARITAANQLFGSMRRELLGAKVASKEAKRTIFVGMILAMLLHGAEGWVVSSQMMKRSQSTHHRWVRSMCRVNLRMSRLHRMSTSSLLKQMGTQDIQCYLDQRVLGWAGHVARMSHDRLPRQLLTSCLNTPRKSGGQALAHGRTLRKTLQRKEIPVNGWMETAQDRLAWRRKCKVVVKLDRIRKKAPDPSSFIGRGIEKLFRKKWFVGTIKSFDVDALTGEQTWHVLYDDGDSEDFAFGELQRVLIERELFGYSNPVAQKTAREERFARRQGQTAAIDMQAAAT